VIDVICEWSVHFCLFCATCFVYCSIVEYYKNVSFYWLIFVFMIISYIWPSSLIWLEWYCFKCDFQTTYTMQRSHDRKLQCVACTFNFLIFLQFSPFLRLPCYRENHQLKHYIILLGLREMYTPIIWHSWSLYTTCLIYWWKLKELCEKDRTPQNWIIFRSTLLEKINWFLLMWKFRWDIYLES
jgi:hypothetical protein